MLDPRIVGTDSCSARCGVVEKRRSPRAGLRARRGALTHSTPRRHPVVGLRPPPPEPDAEAITRHAVHVGSRAIARQAGGTPRGTAAPLRIYCDCAAPVLGPRRGAGVRHFTPSNRSRPRRPVSIPPGGAMESEREQPPPSARHVTVAICDRCGDVIVGDAACRCRTPYDEPAVRRRHRDAVARARATASDRRRRRSSNPAA